MVVKKQVIRRPPERTRFKVRKLFAGGTLPPELLEDGARRLGRFGLFCAAIITFVFLFRMSIKGQVAVREELVYVHLACVCAAAVASFAVFGLWRSRRIQPQLLLDLGLVYEVLLAFVFGLLFHMSMESYTRSSGFSGVAVWILVFSIIIPSTPGKMLLATCAGVLMDPLAWMVTVLAGNPLPPAELIPRMFGPTVMAGIVAVVCSRIVYRMSRDIQQARQLGSYELVELLGKGGMGEVWRAEHRMLARPAAIKLISLEGSPASSANKTLLRRFEREVQATALLESEHTIRLYDFGVTDEGAFYYVMELLDGLDLEALVKQHGPLPPERVVFLLRQVCASLAEAHHGGLIHRDVKPANIYVCHKGLDYDYVKVLDFGLVKSTDCSLDEHATELTVKGGITGTPAYIAPETLKEQVDVDGRADIYALGCVAYWMLSGQLVFSGGNLLKLVMDHVSTEPPRLSERSESEIPAALEEVVHACLEKDRDKRPTSVRELARRLEAIELAEEWTQARAECWWKEHRRAQAGPGESDLEFKTTVPQ